MTGRSRRPTVVMVHDYPPITGGGLAIAVQELARLLGEDLRFEIVSSRLADHFSDDRPTAGRPAFSDGSCQLVSLRRLLGRARRADALVVHWTFSFRWLATLVLAVAPLARKPVVCVIHTCPEHCDYNWVRHVPRRIRPALFALARLLFGRCAAVVALGRTHADSLARVAIRPTRVMPLPVTPTAAYATVYETRAADRRPAATIGIVCELSRLKGADGIPRLVAALTPGHAIRILGRGPLSRALHDALAALSARQRARLRITDHLDPAEMPWFYGELDFLLVPSRTESQCRVALEAMLAGAIVLASRADGIADLVVDGHTGFFVDPEDPQSLLEVLVPLAGSPGEAAAVRERARAFALTSFERSRRDWQAFLPALVYARGAYRPLSYGDSLVLR